jgi:arylsulfatase A-like enzyme
VIVTADHGGHKKTHGSGDRLDTTIPWIVWGAGVQRGDTLSGVRTMDTAATVLWMLKLDVPENWSGRPLARAFEATVANSGNGDR